MKQLASIYIDKLFSAYAVYDTKNYISTGVAKPVYCCADCKATFSVVWPYLGSMRGFADSKVVCPKCGRIHGMYEKSGEYGVMLQMYSSEYIVFNLTIRVTELKNMVLLSIYTDAATFTGDLLRKVKLKETFHFDIRQRKTIFRQYINNCVKTKFEIGTLFSEEKDRLFNESCLRFLKPEAIDSADRKKLDKILRTLREAVARKLGESVDHKVKTMYASCGGVYGRMLVPLLNIAHRIVFTDAPNLPKEFKNGAGFLKEKFGLFAKEQKMFDELEFYRKYNNCIDGVAEKFALPSTKTVRKILSENIFAAPLLSAAFSISSDVNYTKRIFELLKNRFLNGNFKSKCSFYAAMAKLYGMSAVLRLMDMNISVMLPHRCYASIKDPMGDDIRRMYGMIGPKTREKLKDVKFKDLHNFLSKELQKRREEDYSLEVPDSIKRRLLMQKDLVKFFLPETSLELKNAGADLHNCVYSYAGRMVSGKLQIVLVADDKGRLAACLEIQNDILVQAKLRYNRPVRENSAINAEVVEWAERTGLKIGTSDVRKKYLPAIVSAAV